MARVQVTRTAPTPVKAVDVISAYDPDRRLSVVPLSRGGHAHLMFFGNGETGIDVSPDELRAFAEALLEVADQV